MPDYPASPTSRSEGGGEGTELEDIIASSIGPPEELDTKFDRLQLTPPNPQNTNAASWPSHPPPNEVYNLDEIGVIRRVVAPQPAREEPTTHDG